MMALTYGYVYVASVAIGADKNQFIKAITEAESYPGPSMILAYSPCINHGINMSKRQHEEKLAVEAGYWILYCYNPLLRAEGKNPLILDSKEPTGDLNEFLMGEVRYATLVKQFPEEAKRLHGQLQQEYALRYQQYRKMAEAEIL